MQKVEVLSNFKLIKNNLLECHHHGENSGGHNYIYPWDCTSRPLVLDPNTVQRRNHPSHTLLDTSSHSCRRFGLSNSSNHTKTDSWNQELIRKYRIPEVSHKIEWSLFSYTLFFPIADLWLGFKHKPPSINKINSILMWIALKRKKAELNNLNLNSKLLGFNVCLLVFHQSSIKTF